MSLNARMNSMVRNAIVPACVALALGWFVSPAAGQTTTPTTPGVDLSGLNSILQALGGLGGIVVPPSGGGGTATSQPSGGGGGGGGGVGGSTTQLPTIISDQFNTTSSQALRDRSPGSWVKQAVAFQKGETSLTFSGTTDDTNFYTDTANQMILASLDLFSTLLTRLNALFALNNSGLLPSDPGSDSIGTIPNSTTTGAGEETPIQRSFRLK